MIKKVQMLQRYANWNDVPFVKLSNMIRKQKWFTGYAIKMMDEDKFDKEHFPTNLSIWKRLHENVYINIRVDWDFEKQRFEVTVTRPQTEKYLSGNVHFKNKLYDGILSRITEAVSIAEPEANVQLQRIIKTEQENNERIQKAKDIVKEIQIPLTVGDDGHRLYFNREGQHNVAMERNIDDTFRIIVNGNYTLEEATKIIDFIASGTSYAVERLTRTM